MGGVMGGVSRVRWAAVGAAIAVSVGAGGIGIVNATVSSGPRSVYVPISPCRLADTRPGVDNVGVRSAPIGERETHTFTVHGTNGDCVIPAGATAIVANMTAVAPTARSFMTIWPADRPQPTASSLNYVAGQAPVPNAVSVTLSGDGRIKTYNHAGSVHVIIDVAGFYQDHQHDDRYYTRAQVDQRFAAIPGAPVTGQPCTAGVLSGTIVNGHDGDGNVTVKCFRNLVTSLAGSTAGFADGTGAAARFNQPIGVAVDAAGNVYVADTINHRIRKMTPAGAVSTLAGSSEGFLDDVGAAAQFSEPLGVAVDAAGNVYVADTNNHRIRKITPAGVVTTLAGSAQGFVDGTVIAARFNFPLGVAVDAAGNVYVADTGNHRIRSVAPNGTVTTFAGSTSGFADGTGTEARFSGPTGVAVDAAGNVYVADTNNHRIRKITPAGTVSTVAGSAQGIVDGTVTTARLDRPQGVTVDAAGNLYVTDSFNHRIRKVTTAGAVITIAGSTQGFLDGVGTAARLHTPRGIAVDAAGNVYVADSINNRIRKIN